MKAFSGLYVLLLTIALFANWTSIVNGAVAYHEATEQGVAEREVRDTAAQPDITKLLPSVMQGITASTRKPFVMFGASLEDVNKGMRSLQATYTDYCTEDKFVNGTEFNCKLLDNILTLRTVTEQPQHVYLSVHQGSEPKDNSFPTTTCPILTCPTTARPLLTCKDYINKCRTDSNSDWCQRCKIIDCNDRAADASVTTNGETANNGGSPCDMAAGQHSQPEDDTLSITIASIVSFFAGVGVCLLVLCLIRYIRERLCLKPIHTTYVAKTEKSHTQARKSKSLMDTANTTSIAEHEYLDLRCETLPNPTKQSTYSPEVVSPVGQKQSNTTAQTHVYETMSDAQREPVYSGLGSRESNPTTVYERNSPNRSSEHVYSGMLNETQPSDPTTRLPQPLPVNKPYVISDTDVTHDNQINDADNNHEEPNDYFILEKD